MPRRPFSRLCALAGALLIGTLGLGMTSASAVPSAPAPPAAPSPVDEVPSISDAASSAPVTVVVLLKDQPASLSLAEESERLSSQQALIDAWSAEYGLVADRQFAYLVNGFSATVPGDRLSALSLEPEVASVRRERVYERTEHVARDLHGVPAAVEAHGLDGTGMVISIIDSGIDPTHEALRLDDCDAAAIQEINPAAEAGFTCKVPDGYNYADESFEITDAVVDAHGQHVSGIAAANGSPGDVPGDFAETGELDGAAPNAQLLAMKVFSNSGGGATDSDIVAAIEDSVKLDADVINMSLGSPNGQKNASDASSIAIEAARDAGVLSVIAAGNDGQNFSAGGVGDDALGLLDDGTVGSPGTLGSAFTVASIDNASTTQPLAYLEGDPEGLPYQQATGEHDGQPHRLVDLGLATTAETAGQDLEGDYALIARGEISFTEKYENALAAGAGGVVVTNTEDTAFGMAGVETFTLPGITVTSSVGDRIRAAVEAGETTIRITDELSVQPSPTALTPSTFTSWGTTPSLDFEPEIAGIGGGVYSTFNDDTYGTSSGTSMAAPNVAGLSALILQDLAQEQPEVTGAERVDLAQITLMNTAQVPTAQDGRPYSPRQIGAGLARVDAALDTQVVATVDGEGAAALREISGSATFTVTLANSGEADASFTIPGTQLLAETNAAGEATAVRDSAGSVSAPGAVRVPAGGTATVEVTVTPESGADHFTGGWIRFEADAEGQPDLSVPFLGFAGDWNAEQIILPAGEQLEGVGVQSEMITGWGGSTVPLTGESGEFWLSPNGDGDMDAVAANLVVMRNASDIRYSVLDASGQELRVLGEEQGVYRNLFGDWGLYEDPRVLQWTGATFDGTVYDPQEVAFAALPDGRYTYRVQTRLGEDQPWQTSDYPVGIDATAPEIVFGAYEGGVLPFTVTEDGSGLLAPPSATGAGGEEIAVTQSPDGGYALEVDPAQVPFVTVSALDGGANLGVGTKVFADSAMVIANAGQLEDGVLGPRSPQVSDGALQLSGYVSSDIAAVRVEEESVEASEGRFSLTVPLLEGRQELVVEALDAEGTVLTQQTVPVTYDATAPALEITELETDAAGAAIPGEDGAITVAGTVTDEREGAALTVTSGEVSAEVAGDGSFSLTLTPAEDAASFAVVASDGVNTTTESVAISGRATAPTWAMPEVTNADCVFDSAACFVPAETADVSEDGSVFTLRGQYPSGGTLTFTPGSRVGEDGRYVEAESITAQLAEDGSFRVDLPMTTGENHFRMVVTDVDGTVRYDRGVRIYYDVTAPTLQIDEPTLVNSTLYTNTEDVTIAGTAADDGWGYAFSVNDSVVLERFDIGSPGEASNQRSFSTEITVADGDHLLVELRDSNGNVLLGLIPVVLDTLAPTVEIADLAADEVVEDQRTVEVTAEDENLASLQVLVDGDLVAEAATDLTTMEQPLEEALIDLRDLSASGAEEQGTEPETTEPESTEPESSEPESSEPGESEPAEADSAAPPAEQGSSAAFGTRTTAAQTSLSAVVETAELAEGAHTLDVVSTDLAGNVTTEALSFATAAPVPDLSIAGPEAVELSLHREELGDQSALAAEVLEQYSATLDGAPAGDDAELALAPGSVLVEGEQTVTLLATDAAGSTAEKQIAVTVTLELVTLADGDVTATATFRSDDSLETELADAADGSGRSLKLSTAFAPLTAVITVPGTEGEQVLRLLEDGRQVPVASTWADGVLTFEGPSRGSYLLRPAESPGGNGDGGSGDGADGTDGTSGPGEQDGSTGAGAGADGKADDGAAGSGSGGDGAGAGGATGAETDTAAEGDDSADGTTGAEAERSGDLARSGADLLLPLAVAVLLLLVGGVLLALRRRRNSDGRHQAPEDS